MSRAGHSMQVGVASVPDVARACAQAYAAARFAESVLRGLEGEPDVFEAAYVQSSVTELPYFATKARATP